MINYLQRMSFHQPPPVLTPRVVVYVRPPLWSVGRQMRVVFGRTAEMLMLSSQWPLKRSSLLS